MSDKANCKNCIHFDEIKRRCCLNDDSWVQKECYFRRNNKKPMGNDVIFEKQGEIIKDLQSQLDQQKEMWNELKEWVENQIKDLRHIDIKTETQCLRVNDGVNCFKQVLNQMQELKQGEKDDI